MVLSGDPRTTEETRRQKTGRDVDFSEVEETDGGQVKQSSPGEGQRCWCHCKVDLEEVQGGLE